MKDANGVEVFEGDKVTGFWNEFHPCASGEVKFIAASSSFCWVVKLSRGARGYGEIGSEKITVIGNIHQPKSDQP